MTDTMQRDGLPPELAPVCIRLADEGVPLRAISRAVKQPVDNVREAVRDAVLQGTILYQPKEDWAPGSSREIRVPAWVKDGQTVEAELMYNCVRMFKVTRLQAALLAVLLQRAEVTKEAMHLVIQGGRNPLKDETNPKMVDVVICHLRKRLREHGLVIHTLWARGYYIEPAQRKFVMDMIEKYVDGTFTQDDLKSMPPSSDMEKGRGKSKTE